MSPTQYMPLFFQHFLLSIAYVPGIVNIKLNSDLANKKIDLKTKAKTDMFIYLYTHCEVKYKEINTIIIEIALLLLFFVDSF